MINKLLEKSSEEYDPTNLNNIIQELNNLRDLYILDKKNLDDEYMKTLKTKKISVVDIVRKINTKIVKQQKEKQELSSDDITRMLESGVDPDSILKEQVK